MKKYLVILIFLFISCTDASKRMKYLQKEYPQCKVEPATGIIREKGYEFIIIYPDQQIIAVSFYLWSEDKIQSFRNVR